MSHRFLKSIVIISRDAIKQIYDGSHQNYGAPKITEMLHRQGESIAEKTVGNYMRQMGDQKRNG